MYGKGLFGDWDHTGEVIGGRGFGRGFEEDNGKGGYAFLKSDGARSFCYGVFQCFEKLRFTRAADGIGN